MPPRRQAAQPPKPDPRGIPPRPSASRRHAWAPRVAGLRPGFDGKRTPPAFRASASCRKISAFDAPRWSVYRGMEASCGVLRFGRPALGRARELLRDAPAGPAPGWSGAPEGTQGRGGWAATAGEAEPLALGTSPTGREEVAPVRAAAATHDADGPAVPGDEQGFAAVVRKHQGMVHAIAWHFLRDYAAAEDLAQDVFLSLYAHRDEIASPQHLVNWLRQVASRKCLDRRRRRTPEPLPAELTAPDSAGPAGMGDPWQKARLRRLLAQVPAQPRMVLLLRYQQELGIEEIAAALAMPAATVRSHLRRSLARLRRQWRKAAQGARS